MTFTLITGMHRSGTSMLAQLLARSDIHLGHPHELLQSPPQDNPDGYWENIAGLQLNEEILQRLGGSWRTVPPLPPGWETRSEFELFPHRMHGVFPPNAAQPQAFKDPRTTLTLRLWQRAYPQARLVVCLRNPIEVAYSLGSGLNQFRDLTFPEAVALWQTYYETLLRTIQPADALWVHYESLLLDPSAALDRIFNHIGLSRSAAEIQSAVTIVKTGHRHHAIPNDLVHGNYPSAAVAQYYSYLSSFCGDDWRTYLSDPQRQYPIARAYLQTAVPEVLRQHEQSTAHIQHLEQQHAQLQATLASEQIALQQALIQQATLRAEVNELQSYLADRQTRLDQTRAQLTASQSLHSEAAALSAQIIELNTQLAQQTMLLTQAQRQAIILQLQLRPHQSPLRQRVIVALRTRLAQAVQRLLVPFGLASPAPLFDAGWYAQQAQIQPHTAKLAYRHYLSHGWRAGHAPHPLFSVTDYLNNNPDVRAAGVEPLQHYLTIGWREGRNPHPLFDGVWYLTHNPDVLTAGVEPLQHYLAHGWREGRNPSPHFDTNWYLEQHPEVADQP